MTPLKKKIKVLYTNSLCGEIIFYLPRKIYEFILYRLISSSLFLKIRYREIFKLSLNLVNPCTFNEKIQWLKLNVRDDILRICSDKFKVREYVKEKIGDEFLIPLIISTERISYSDFAILPNSFVIKSNNGSGNNLIVWNKETIIFEEIQKEIKKWKRNRHYYNTKEWQYKHIKHIYLVEKLLINEYGNVPSDIKLHCFNGKIEFIQVDIDRHTDHKRCFYDRNWKMLPFNLCMIEDGEPKIKPGNQAKKPDNLSKMLEIAEKLSSDFIYVRIDLYDCNSKIYFGEMTFHHGSGFEQFRPNKYYKIYGDKLVIKTI
jgi:hypothetical protein